MRDQQENRNVMNQDLEDNNSGLFRMIVHRLRRHEKRSRSCSSSDSGSSGTSSISDGSSEKQNCDSDPTLYKCASSSDVRAKLKDNSSMKWFVQMLRTQSIEIFTEDKRNNINNKKKNQKKILRPPQTYVYVRGISGMPMRLPTSPQSTHPGYTRCHARTVY